MAIRKPRGYTVNRPPYVELCEGVRPNVHSIPLEAWTGLPPVRIDDQHNDPIVIDAGTLVGVSTGTYAGKLFPAVNGFANTGITAVAYQFTSDDSRWGLTTTDQTVNVGVIKPMGVVYQPIYSFNLQNAFTNYQRNVNVGVVTDYVVQVPAITNDEHAIRPGDLVMVADGNLEYGRPGELSSINNLAGRFKKWDGTLAGMEFVVGRCLRSMSYATTTSSTGTKYQDDANATTSTAAKAEFPGLDQVETVPGMALSGSGTGGVPGHLLGGYSLSSAYRLITVLVRL